MINTEYVQQLNRGSSSQETEDSNNAISRMENVKKFFIKLLFGENPEGQSGESFVTHLSSKEAGSPSFYLRLGALGNLTFYIYM